MFIASDLDVQFIEIFSEENGALKFLSYADHFFNIGVGGFLSGGIDI